MIARFGFKCRVCLAFAGIHKASEDQAAAARAWKAYQGEGKDGEKSTRDG